MEIELRYGEVRRVKIDVPRENLYFAIDRGTIPAVNDLELRMREKLRRPIGTQPVSEIVKAEDRVLIIVDDLTRPTPQEKLLPILLDELNALGIPDRRIEVLIALGSHRPMTSQEIEGRFGREVVQRVEVSNHEYDRPEKLVDIGRTSSGIPVSINRKALDVGSLIGVGNIAPHILAGWGGGGKIIQPGICGEETTTAVHVEGHLMNPIENLVGKMDQKVRRDIDAIALKAGLKMILNTVLNQDDQVGELFIGHLVQAHREGVRFAEELYSPSIPGYADIVVVSSYPADIDYWQAIKPLSYACKAVRKGGTIVFITPCPEGISPAHPIMKERATVAFEENLKLVKEGKTEDKLAVSTLITHEEVKNRASIICYSEGLSRSDKEALGFQEASSPQEALTMALEKHSRNAKIGVLKSGEILPRIRRSLDNASKKISVKRRVSRA